MESTPVIGYTSDAHGTLIVVSSQKEDFCMSTLPLSVISKGETTVIDPLPEPRATLDASERVMVATSALLRDLSMSPKTLERWGTLMETNREELQRNALGLARLSSKEAR